MFTLVNHVGLAVCMCVCVYYYINMIRIHKFIYAEMKKNDGIEMLNAKLPVSYYFSSVGYVLLKLVVMSVYL